jgi:hypothetical protein
MGGTFVKGKLLFLCLLAGACALSAGASVAETANPLIGKWIEKFANGNAMVTEFTPTTISSTPMDAAGKPQGAPRKAEVSYRLVHSGRDLGQEYAIDFKGTNGQPGGGILAYLKNSDSVILDFPGLAAHPMTRLKP